MRGLKSPPKTPNNAREVLICVRKREALDERVADKVRPTHLHHRSFGDVEDDAVVADLVALEDIDGRG